MSGKVALIFVFNHRYDNNIEVLERIYKDRFTNIFHLVPFYNGSKQNVISVFENSFYFQGYFSQGLNHFFNKDYEHYFFVGDDLLLNTEINENNYKEYFKLTENDSFIPEIFNLHNFTNRDTLRFESSRSSARKREKLYWWRMQEIIKYRHEIEGVENIKEIPPYQEAFEKLQKHGYPVKPLSFHDIYGFFPSSPLAKRNWKDTIKFIYHLKRYNQKFNLSYPLVGSYSDIVIVSKVSIKDFCHYCGVFATNNLFVEAAIPTALLLSSCNVVTEKQTGKRGKIYWLYSDDEIAQYEADMKVFNKSLVNLLRYFPSDKLYIHPIKLSKWKLD